jgi:hypothetical protein
MTQPHDQAISDVLDRLEEAARDEEVSVQEIMDRLGRKSFAALILVASLISASPASAIPGLTATVGVIVLIMVAQMLVGRDHAWLPDFIARRRVPSARVRQAVGWLRRPVGFVERFLRPRLGFLVHRPVLYLPLLAIMSIALVMPFLEIIPTSGSIASVAIALFAAGLLTRDGLLVLLALVVVAGVPALIWRFVAG